LIHQEISKVVKITELAEKTFRVVLIAPHISSNARAGQFIEILPSSNWNHIMRRPMSIASQSNNEISIIFKVVGDGTRLMSQWKVDDAVDIIGPLGNYWSDYEEYFPIIIGGGVGIAPILNLNNDLENKGIDHYMIMGARSKPEHFLNHEPDTNIAITTDDGSYGLHGNVIDALKTFIHTPRNITNYKIFTCGPPKMMDAVKDFAIEHDIECDLSLEALMACGIGNCQGCAVQRKSNSDENTYRTKYALVCKDGPIFNAKELA
jgi:dihydroorotate dehydrogenase electron transfer subunit